MSGLAARLKALTRPTPDEGTPRAARRKWGTGAHVCPCHATGEGRTRAGAPAGAPWSRRTQVRCGGGAARDRNRGGRQHDPETQGAGCAASSRCAGRRGTRQGCADGPSGPRGWTRCADVHRPAPRARGGRGCDLRGSRRGAGGRRVGRAHTGRGSIPRARSIDEHRKRVGAGCPGRARHGRCTSESPARLHGRGRGENSMATPGGGGGPSLPGPIAPMSGNGSGTPGGTHAPAGGVPGGDGPEGAPLVPLPDVPGLDGPSTFSATAPLTDPTPSGRVDHDVGADGSPLAVDQTSQPSVCPVWPGEPGASDDAVARPAPPPLQPAAVVATAPSVMDVPLAVAAPPRPRAKTPGPRTAAPSGAGSAVPLADARSKGGLPSPRLPDVECPICRQASRSRQIRRRRCRRLRLRPRGTGCTGCTGCTRRIRWVRSTFCR